MKRIALIIAALLMFAGTASAGTIYGLSGFGSITGTIEIGITGTVDTSTSLPTDAEAGVLYVTLDTNYGWLSEGDNVWTSVGALVGPTGDTGATGAAGADGTDGYDFLLASTDEAAGANCDNGGVQITGGLDGDDDGVLDSGEITFTSYVCDSDLSADGDNTFAGANTFPSTVVGPYFATDPTSPETGQWWIDSATESFNFYNGTSVVDLGVGSSTDDQTASEVTITDSADQFTATTVEAALAELATDLSGGVGTDDQTAVEVSVSDAGGYFTGTTVEAILQEIAVELSLTSSYSLTLDITSTDDTTTTAGDITIGGTTYTITSAPYTITGLSGATTVTASYSGTDDTLAWSGTDSADVSGSTPTYSITMDETKSISADFTTASSYSDIIFFADGESLTTADVAAGSSTITCGALVTSESGIMGNSLRTNSENYSPISISATSNVDFDSGVIGFYYKPVEAWARLSSLVSDGLNSSGTQVFEYTATDLRTEYRDGGAQNSTGAFTTDTLYWVQIVIDSGSADVEYYECTSTTSCSTIADFTTTDAEGTASDGTVLAWGNLDSTSTRDGYIDQIIISNDSTRDLYAIRNNTSF